MLGQWVWLVGVAGGYCMGNMCQLNYALVMLMEKYNNIIVMYSLGMAHYFLLCVVKCVYLGVYKDLIILWSINLCKL
jgi:hypothetical protein